MKEVVLPDGRKVSVRKGAGESIVVEFNDEKMNVKHQFKFHKTVTPEQVADYINKYLNGYTDPETGEHIEGYYERIEKMKTQEQEKQKVKEWWE